VPWRCLQAIPEDAEYRKVITQVATYRIKKAEEITDVCREGHQLLAPKFDPPLDSPIHYHFCDNDGRKPTRRVIAVPYYGDCRVVLMSFWQPEKLEVELDDGQLEEILSQGEEELKLMDDYISKYYLDNHPVLSLLASYCQNNFSSKVRVALSRRC